MRGCALPDLRVALTLPVPGAHARFLNVLPQPDGLVYIGLTDESVDGEPPDVPEPSAEEVEFLLTTVSSSLARPLSRADVVGSYAGLRPLLKADGRTSDLSRRHAVLTSRSGVVTVVGGKLTTYRRMAEDAVDAAVPSRHRVASEHTARLPLAGAALASELARLAATSSSPRLVRRYRVDAGWSWPMRERSRAGRRRPPRPVTRVPVTLASSFEVTHEAPDVADLLDRRIRVGLVASDRTAAEPAAQRAIALATAALR